MVHLAAEVNAAAPRVAARLLLDDPVLVISRLARMTAVIATETTNAVIVTALAALMTGMYQRIKHSRQKLISNQ